MSQEPGPAGRRRGLGMGLSALLGPNTADLEGASSAQMVRQVPIELLSPSRLQPRRHFEESELEALAESLRTRGVLQPLLVRARGDGFEIIAGERRWRAAQRAGLHELPVLIQGMDDREALEIALIENVQRQDLTPLEEAEGYRQLIDEYGYTQEKLAGAVGKSRSHLTNLLRLLGLPEPVRSLLEDGTLSAGHARALLSAEDPVGLAKLVVSGGLNVRQTEQLVHAERSTPPRPRRQRLAPEPNVLALERDLSHRLGLGIKLRPKGEGGEITIAYRTLDQLEALLAKLK